jgi:hypothetical protein
LPAPAVGASYDGRDLQALALYLAKPGRASWGVLAAAVVKAEAGDASGFAPAAPALPYPSAPMPGVVRSSTTGRVTRST